MEVNSQNLIIDHWRIICMNEVQELMSTEARICRDSGTDTKLSIGAQLHTSNQQCIWETKHELTQLAA